MSTWSTRIAAAATAGCLSVLIAGAAGAAEITGVAGMGPLPEVVGALIPAFERASGHKVKMDYVGGPALLAAAKDGKADIVITGVEVVDDLVKDGSVPAANRANIFHSRVGVAVREGTPKPNIGTSEALKAALVAAKTVGYSQGTSGVHFLTVIARLGLVDVIKSKAVVVQGRPVGAAIASGEAEIGVQQVAELMPVPGITLLGDLPGDLQKTIVYTAAVPAKAKESEAAKAFVKFLTSEAAVNVYKNKGMTPPI
jgi:molybdate transport system substrate-binding protein